MDPYEYHEFRQALRMQMAEELKLTYENRLNEYNIILEQYKGLEIKYGTQEYDFLLDEMRKKQLCSLSDSLRIGLLLNKIKFKYRWGIIKLY